MDRINLALEMWECLVQGSEGGITKTMQRIKKMYRTISVENFMMIIHNSTSFALHTVPREIFAKNCKISRPISNF